MARRGSVYAQLHSALDSDRHLNLMMLCKYTIYWLLKHEIAHTTNYQSL